MAEMAASFQRSVLDRRFRVGENRTSLGRDTVAGVTTFIVRSYIIFVNPQVLGFAGIPGLEDRARSRKRRRRNSSRAASSVGGVAGSPPGSTSTTSRSGAWRRS